MNAKKISTLLLCAAGITMLAACTKTVDRASAIKLLGDMNTVVTADGYKTPTTLKAVASTRDTKTSGSKYAAVTTNNFKVVSDKEVYFSSETSSSKTIAQLKDGKVSMSFSGSNEGISYSVYAVIDTTATDSASTARRNRASEAIAAVTTGATTQGAVIVTTPAKMKKYLSAFGAGTGASALPAAGATIGDSTYLSSESYSSSGAGNLDMKITPHYTAKTYAYDEPLEYKFDGSKVTMIQNDSKGTESDYTWGSASPLAFSTTGLTDKSSDDFTVALIDAAVIAVASVAL
jgi:hypothetical protein